MGNCCAVLSTPRPQNLEAPNLKIFTFAELKKATGNFKPETVIGRRGDFGRVYKGWLDDNTLTPTTSRRGMPVAIKYCIDSSRRGLEEWQTTVKFLGKYLHPNIIKLLGCCSEGNRLLLVHEFMANGSLDNHLFRRSEGMQPLTWSLRLKILLGAARGLAFLHSSEKQVIYRDFKAANILLDSNYNAKLYNFGLATHGPTGENSHLTTRVMGTLGYAAPEYLTTGHLYVKSDVYGFGVVLLEVISGRRLFDFNRPSEQENLVDWARPFLSDSNEISRVMDPQLEANYSLKGALQAAQLVLQCVTWNPQNRPSMEKVVVTLENIKTISEADAGDCRSMTAGRPMEQPGTLITMQEQAAHHDLSI